MKVFRIIARLNVGGPARHVVWLTKALQNEEFRSVLAAGTVPPGEEDMGWFAEANGVKPVFIEEMSRELSARDAISLLKVWREIKRTRPDIIHTHTAKAGTVGRLAGFLYRWLTWKTLIGRPRPVKIVHTFHGHVFHSYYGRLKTKIFLAIEKLLARFATNRIIVITDQQLNEINGDFGVGSRKQFRVIPLGIDLDIYEGAEKNRQILRDELGVGDGDILVGFVGRLTEIKNIGLLLRAAQLDDPNAGSPGLKFVIIGDGHLRESLEKEAAALGVSGKVHFLGNRDDAEVFYPALDIVALTSHNEGTPLSLIEAMACGRPVISTAVGGVIDLLGEAGEVRENYKICERGVSVTPGSAEGLHNGLVYLAKTPQIREKLAAEGRTFAWKRYNKERLVNDIKNLYRELVPEGK